MSRIQSLEAPIELVFHSGGQRFFHRALKHQVTLHPSWLETCSRISCSGLEVGTPEDNPRKVDAAIVRLDWNEPGVPHSPIDFTPVLEGDRLVLAGRGCTANIGEPGSGLRYGESIAVAPETMIHPGSLYSEVALLAAESYLVTPGHALDRRYPSLCSGDSGGPVFKNGKLAGVHADYTFYEPYESGTISVTNLHTRVDNESFYNVGAWIREALKR